MAGRRPLPTAIKELNGNPGKRPLNKREPKPRKTRPKPPPLIANNAAALQEWKRIVRLLWPTGVLTAAEADILTMYCVAYRQWVDAIDDLRTEGLIIKSPATGYPMQNPLLAVANQAAKTMRALLVELGMTPAARSRIVAATPPDHDEFDAFLSGAWMATHDGAD